VPGGEVEQAAGQVEGLGLKDEQPVLEEEPEVGRDLVVA
jgi:hypothetical protein